MADTQGMKYGFLAEGLVDWVGLWEFVGAAEIELGNQASSKEIESFVLDVLKSLHDEELVVFGDLVSDGKFVSWPEQSNALDRIAAEWRVSGHDPNPGEVFWMQNTEKGNETARRLTLET